MPQDRPRRDHGRNDVISGQNAHDGHLVRASIVWRRKWIGVEEESLVPGQTEIVKHIVLAEALIWRGGWFNLNFRPTLIISYRPEEPTNPDPKTFRELTLKIISNCDLSEVTTGKIDTHLHELCAPYRIWPMFGYRRLITTFRRVPHVLLFGWPAGRPFPDRA
jgi:hypothetical protein